MSPPYERKTFKLNPQQNNGLLGYYFKDKDLNDLAFTKVDSTVDFDWKGASPDPQLSHDRFSIRWMGTVTPLYSEVYTFYVASDDGCRLWINDQLIVDRWVNQGLQEWSGQILVEGNQPQQIKLEYYEDTGDARVYLRWSSPSQSKEIIPTTQLAPPSAPPDHNTFPHVVDAREFNAIPIEEVANFDSTEALNNAIDSAVTEGLPLFIPKGTYRITDSLVAASNQVMIYGAGAKNTVIRADDNTAYDGLIVGTDEPSGVEPSGFVRDLSIVGKTARPSGFKAGLKLNAMRSFQVQNVFVDNYDIGFDLINNCYGSYFIMPRTWAGVNVGVNLRTGPQSGNDIQFYNGWFVGNIAAVHVSNDSGGFQFYGGQMTSGWYENNINDERGVITLGKDYITGRIGGVGNFSVDGVNLEGFKLCWAIRCFDTAKATFRNVGMQANDPSIPAIGVFKSSLMAQSRIVFDRFQANGNYSNAKLIQVDNTYALASITEVNCGYGGSIQGQGTFGGSMLVQSEIDIGQSLFRKDYSQLLIGSILLRDNNGALEKSSDWGTTWSLL
ncbi:PA14 domain-containing protein [Longirhabdus pacifica]|uniref:PA14 domain-containing protein n=1 Tax=Longirhabdus pacifica TaxID=2305227 RepID=UPI001008A90A|nr:PA14 domain-containing protein [Longirhabdus pacifica]